MNVFVKAVILVTSLSGLLVSCSEEVSITPESEVNATKPSVVGAISTGNTSVIITFSNPMNDEAVNPVNYSITQENVSSEAGALSVTGVSFYGNERKTVVLTTMSQNEVTYRVTVVNVQDVNGQQFEVVATNTGYYTADSASFAGTPPGGNSMVDSDGDGLLDNEEQRGWLISIVNGNGQVLVREVTSDSTIADTDGDGLSDSVERSLNTDPRTRDTDGDQLSDAHEYNGIFSSPDVQDSDGDGLMDGEEVLFYKTSPLLDDTDGDQFLDGAEVVLANRNARIADLAQPTIEIESISLELDVRFDKTKDATTTKGDIKTVSATLTQSNSKTHAKTNEENNKVAASVTVSNSVEVGVDTLIIPKGKFSVAATGSVEHGWSSSWSSESSKQTQNEYNKSLETSEQLSEGTTVSRRIDGARVSTLVYLAAEGDVAFTIRDLQITALVADIRNPGKYLPVATLIPENPDGDLDNAFNLGPLADKIGPLIFTSKDIFPAQVERLMRDPSGVIFKISNYNITDEAGRNFAYSSQDVVDRTTSVSLDFGGTDLNGDGLGEGTEFYRVATSFGRTIGSIVDDMAQQFQITSAEVRAAYGLAFDDNDSLISYDLSGKNTGVVFHDVMQNVLGLKHYDSAVDIPASDASGQFASYATTFNSNGVERITRIRQIAEGAKGQWSLLTPTGLILDGQLSFGAGGVTANDQILLPGSGISLAYIQDNDGDKIPARLEYLHGCSDDKVDTDGDGLNDYLEVFGAPKNPDGSYVNIDDKWGVDVKSIGTYQGFSSCGSVDTDVDGIPDYYEYHGFDDITVDPATGEFVFTAYTSGQPVPRTDAKSQDTDDDGISDLDEAKGYIAYLEFPRVTTGNAPSKCTDEVNDTGDGRDKVLCTSDPLNPDTDGDVLPDGAEFAFFADPTVYDSGDISDVDGDGLLGREEVDGWPVTFIYAGAVDIYQNGAYLHQDNLEVPLSYTCEAGVKGCFAIHPVLPEFSYGVPFYKDLLPVSNPIYPDSDDDGLQDNWERDISLANTGYVGSTHPGAVDTDQDGRPDFEELIGYPYKSSEFDASKTYQGTSDAPVTTDPLLYDTDGDGRSDGDEVDISWQVDLVGVSGSKTVYSDPRDGDIDNDGLNDIAEKVAFTDPNNDNTDSQNEIIVLNDGDEVRLGLDPTDSSDMCVRVTFGEVVVHLASGGEGYFSDANIVLDASKQGVGNLGQYFNQGLPGITFVSGAPQNFTHEAYVILSATKTASLKGITLKFSKSGTADTPDFPDTARTLHNTEFAGVGTVSLNQSSVTTIGAGSFSIGINGQAEVIDEATLNTLLQADPANTFCQSSL